jgi:RNA polymerase sigma factor (sigma-70 family)
MEVSALKHSGGIGLHARSPLLRLQSDERLVALVRRGSSTAFEVLVARYESRLLSFCRHLLGSREDAEDVLQEVMAAAFNAMIADDRPINVRPWLYRIARNRSLNHLRRIQSIGMDSMDVHLSEHGLSTADKVHGREEFRLLVGDIHELPETQKTALVLREMDALSYEQIAEAMETTVPSVKSLLVRARVSLAEAAEARLLSCEEVRIELGEVAEGLRRRNSPLVRRHLKACRRCSGFRTQLKQTNKALTAIMPLGPFVVLKKLIITHVGHSAGSGATAAGSGAAGSTAAAGGGLLAGTGASGFVSAGMGAIATKAAAGLAAAALVTGAAVEVEHSSKTHPAKHPTTASLVAPAVPAPAPHVSPAWASPVHVLDKPLKKTAPAVVRHPDKTRAAIVAAVAVKTTTTTTTTSSSSTASTPAPPAELPGRTQKQTDPTVLAPGAPPPPTSAGTPTQAATPATAPALSSTPIDSTKTLSNTTTTSSSPPPPPPPSDQGAGAPVGPGLAGTGPATP